MIRGEVESIRQDNPLRFYEGSVEDKLRLARSINALYGATLQRLPGVPELLERLIVLAEQLGNRMRNMNMDSLCAVCGGEDRGGCCSIEMADNSDALLLTMNLLLGCVVEFRRNDGFECYFLGKRGCTLLLKPMFCLNYNCRKIHRHNPAAAMTGLERSSGRLLRAQTQLESILIVHLRNRRLEL